MREFSSLFSICYLLEVLISANFVDIITDVFLNAMVFSPYFILNFLLTTIHVLLFNGDQKRVFSPPVCLLYLYPGWLRNCYDCYATERGLQSFPLFGRKNI